jgi:hypothetical protein
LNLREARQLGKGACSQTFPHKTSPEYFQIILKNVKDEVEDNNDEFGLVLGLENERAPLGGLKLVR